MSKSAKEMFAELGYKEIKHNVFEEKAKPNTFVTQDMPYIEYRAKGIEDEEIIRFDFLGQIIWFQGLRKIGQKYVQLPCPINISELQAINKQIEELNWNNE